MITRDFILRQIQQLVQVLARVMMLRSARQEETALQEIDRALSEISGMDVLLHPGLHREDVLATCGTGNDFNPEKALVLADVLVEKAELLREEEGRRQYLQYAQWLFQGVLSNESTAIPLDIYDRMTWIKAQLDEEDE